MTANYALHSNCKHIDIRSHFIREAVRYKINSINYLPTNDMPIDVLIRSPNPLKHFQWFETHRNVNDIGIGVVSSLMWWGW